MLVMENLMRLLSDQDVDVVWTWPVSVDWRRHKRRILSMPAVDAIIINGEGTIHHNDSRRFSQALIDMVDFAADTLKVPCYLLNATLHKNTAAAYQSLGRARAIYVRDRGSLKELQEFGGLTGAYVPDLTFASNVSHSGDRSECDRTLVIDSAVKEDSRFLEAYASDNGFDFRSMVVARPSNARFLRSPRPWVRNVIKWLKSDRKLATDAGSYIRYLRGYGMVITGRYHTVTMCLKNRIPFIALESNTPKVRYLLTDVLGEAGRSLTVSDLTSGIPERLRSFNEKELEAITLFTADAEVAIESMIADICNDISRGAQGRYEY
jgi:polysaccharide pyruvyl transferase WcaK-like protein